MATFGGWSGKTLRVDLSAGTWRAEDTVARYRDVLGGTGVGYKVLWDEVPARTRAFSKENKIILGTGPLTGTASPCAGRTSITTIFPVVYPDELVATGHMGGAWGSELKYAGWDNIIIEGQSAKPVYLAIVDDKVEIRDAGHLWGNGVYHATSSICQEMGAATEVAAIGQAGENQVRLASLMTGFSHSAGGVGGVFGSKRLKAIAVKGSGAVRIATDKKEWKELVRYTLSIMGANNQHVVPSTPQPWAEFHSPGSRWTARKGLFWGAADPAVETGECRPEDLNQMAFRTAKATYDLGPNAEKYTVRMGGCASCPIRCHSHLDVPAVEQKYGMSRYAASTCIGWGGRSFFKSFPDGARGQASIEAAVVGKHLADDLGIWTHYSQLQRDFKYAYDNGFIKANLPASEYQSIPWDRYEAGDPGFLREILTRIAYKQGEFGAAMGEGSGRVAERWKFPAEYYRQQSASWWKLGHPKHHSSEDGGQTGVLINMMYNRDSQCHSHSNFLGNGLPIGVQKELASKIWGAGAVDPENNLTPMNIDKARFAAWSVLRKELHDSLTLCNWMYPLAASPLKTRGYEGDNGIEAKLYSAVTGDRKSPAELDLVAERIFNLHRVLTMRDMATADMRARHDTAPDWVFDNPPDQKPFTPGHSRMDRTDIELARDLLYQVLSWDRKTGSPTRALLEKLGLRDAADRLEKAGILGSPQDSRYE